MVEIIMCIGILHAIDDVFHLFSSLLLEGAIPLGRDRDAYCDAVNAVVHWHKTYFFVKILGIPGSRKKRIQSPNGSGGTTFLFY